MEVLGSRPLSPPLDEDASDDFALLFGVHDAGELAKDAAAEKPPLGGSKVAAGPTRARKGKERSKATDDPTNSVIEAHNDLINSVVLHHASGKASEHVTLVSVDVGLQIEGLCPDVLIATERGPALITRVANAISFCAGVAEDFDSSPLGVYAGCLKNRLR